MIKREHKTICSSVVIPNDKVLYDLTREKTYKVKLFGFTIYETSENFKSDDIIEHNKNNKTGFK